MPCSGAGAAALERLRSGCCRPRADLRRAAAARDRQSGTRVAAPALAPAGLRGRVRVPPPRYPLLFLFIRHLRPVTPRRRHARDRVPRRPPRRPSLRARAALPDRRCRHAGGRHRRQRGRVRARQHVPHGPASGAPPRQARARLQRIAAPATRRHVVSELRRRARRRLGPRPGGLRGHDGGRRPRAIRASRARSSS